MNHEEYSYLIKSTYGNSIELTQKQKDSLEILEHTDKSIIFLYKSHRYNAQIIESDDELKNVKLRINNQIVDLSMQDDLDQLIDKMGLVEVDDENSGEVISPMPGLVLDIMVSEGDRVEKGDSLLVLEAMKMENLIQSPADGVVSKINCEKSKTVEKGSLLIEITAE